MAIVFGTTIQGKAKAVPKEVYFWLIERNSKYPDIDFKIEVFEPLNEEQTEEYKQSIKYSRVYIMDRFPPGVKQVVFPYLKSHWIVRIVGGADDNGNIAKRDETTRALPGHLRMEIAGIPKGETPDMAQISKLAWGVVRKSDDTTYLNSEMMPLSPDGEWTSGISLTGQQLQGVLDQHKQELGQVAKGNLDALNHIEGVLKKESEKTRGEKP